MARNTLIFTAFLAVIAATLIGFNVGRRIQQSSLAPTPTPTPKSTLLTFTSEPCGVTFEYPSSLAKLDGASGSAVFTDPANANNGIAVICQADIPRVPVPEEQIETVGIPTASGATFSATLYHDASQKDGTPVDKLIFTHPKTGLDVYVAGFGATFNQILTTLKLL